ncbi:two-component sensor histidine kinase, partial [candidate division GN15 bacterium]|nr:two-component sensor histidine kinase [candidate division GN15 bacterium]
MEGNSAQFRLPSKDEIQERHEAQLPRYRRLRRYLIIITSVAALTPLIIMAVINYVQDTDAYQAESRYAVSRILSNTKRTLMFAIEERRSAIELLIQEKTFSELASDSALSQSLNRLKSAFGGFVDLGLIDADGDQLFYSGPYELKGINYSDQVWFHEVVVRGGHVSNVFLGHRNLPHFVIAIKKNRPWGDFYILRATIDMEMIYRHIYSLNLDRDTDVFLINENRILQTPSAFFGDALQTIDITIPPHSREREIVMEHELNDAPATMGYSYIAESPFILVVLHSREASLAYWLSHRAEMLWFLVASVLMILLVVAYSAYIMTNRLRQADLRRAKIFHNIEYTSKMATLGRLAASVAHEINNPLAIINEKAGLLKDMATYTEGFPHKDKAVTLVGAIEDSVQRCSRVTHR